MDEIMEAIYRLFGWKIDYDKIIQKYQELITNKQQEIKVLERLMNEAYSNKLKQRIEKNCKK